MMDLETILKKLNIKVYLDGADLDSIKKYANMDVIYGFTSNPSLMSQSGISDYKDFITNTLSLINEKPISFEVVEDENDLIIEQAKRIASFAKNIYVKIPIVNTKGISCIPAIKELSDLGVPLNITAIMTSKQAIQVMKEVPNPSADIILSIFAGRIADTGRDPKITFKETIDAKANNQNYKTLWASPREIYNLYEADHVGADLITITPQILNKINLNNKDLDQYSIETVQMFYNDAKKNNLEI